MKQVKIPFEVIFDKENKTFRNLTITNASVQNELNYPNDRTIYELSENKRIELTKISNEQVPIDEPEDYVDITYLMNNDFFAENFSIKDVTTLITSNSNFEIEIIEKELENLYGEDLIAIEQSVKLTFI